MLKYAVTLAAITIGVLASGSASATIITEIGGSSPWQNDSTSGNGAYEIVNLTGLGGNLENDAPLPTGAVKLTTGADNSDRAQIGIADSFGRVGDILNQNISFSYSFLKVDSGNIAAAPSLKLTFLNPNYQGDGYVQLVYEPYWNLGSSVTTDEWLDMDISFTDGLFWNTGGFGQANSAGGPPLLNLAGWLNAFDSGFEDAQLIGLSIGVGTYNQNQIGYFDNVVISGTEADGSYDFEAKDVSAPATGLLMLTSLGFLAFHRRQLLQTKL